MRLTRDQLYQRARDLAIREGVTVKEGYKLLGRRAGKASAAKRKLKLLSSQPTLPIYAQPE